MATKSHWSPEQIKHFAKQIRAEYKNAWDYMVPAVRRAMVDSFVLGIIRLQHREAVEIVAIDELVLKLHAAMGTAE